MRKSRFPKKSIIAISAGICLVPSLASAVSIYNDSLADYAGNSGGNAQGIGGLPNPGDSYEDIASVVITNNASTIFFQINLNPSITNASGTNTTDILTTAQSYGKYVIGMETGAPGTGSTAVQGPYNAIGISTGMNYVIDGWTDGGGGGTDASPDTGDNQVFGNYSASNATNNGWGAAIAGSGTNPYVTTTTVLSQTSITYGIPLSVLGLSTGNKFNFDAWTTFDGGGGAYDALDSGANATSTGTTANNNAPNPGYMPWTPTPYDSATAVGSTYSTTTYQVVVPTFTWNDGTAAAGFADGKTWDINDTNEYNWNNGIFADYYTDNINVIFNDQNGGNYAVTLNTMVNPNSVVFNNSSGNYTISGTGGQIGGTGSLTKMGSSTATLDTVNTYSGGTIVQAGTLVVGVNGALPNGSLSITGGTLQLATGTGLASLKSLSITGSGVLDVANNHVILSYGATDPASSIYNMLKTGYNGGAWTGVGIDSSTAALPANSHYGVGFVDGADHVPGSSVTSGQIEIAYALYGDVNLDGLVNATDFAIFGANFNKSVTGWDHGDFTYTGLINGSDFALLGSNFGKSASGTAVSLPASDWAALDAFATANGLALPSVPEPASAALLVVAGMGMLGKRRRR